MNHWIYEVAGHPMMMQLAARAADAPGSTGQKHLIMMLETVLQAAMSPTKACRWIGWVQGVLVSQGVATLEQMKDLNKEVESKFEPDDPKPVALVGEHGGVSWRTDRVLPEGAPLYSEPATIGLMTLNAIAALRYYANGHHMLLSEPDKWDTVSGEPPNFKCDEAGTATVEDGSIAALALQGMEIDWGDGEERFVPEPVENERLLPGVMPEGDARDDMLVTYRAERELLREALGVPEEPHQILLERMVDAARGKPRPVEVWRIPNIDLPPNAVLVPVEVLADVALYLHKQVQQAGMLRMEDPSKQLYPRVKQALEEHTNTIRSVTVQSAGELFDKMRKEVVEGRGLSPEYNSSEWELCTLISWLNSPYPDRHTEDGSLEPGSEATVYHAGTNSYYRAKIKQKMPLCEVEKETQAAAGEVPQMTVPNSIKDLIGWYESYLSQETIPAGLDETIKSIKKDFDL